METQFKKGVLEMAVLCELTKKDQYGYELVTKISKEISITEGTMYPLLRRLKKEGLLDTYTKESTEGPIRKYYTITNEGENKARELKKEWLNFSKKITRLLGEKK